MNEEDAHVNPVSVEMQEWESRHQQWDRMWIEMGFGRERFAAEMVMLWSVLGCSAGGCDHIVV